MSKIYTVTMIVNDGPYAPAPHTTVHLNLQDAQVEFGVCVESIGEDPTTVILKEIDALTGSHTDLDTVEVSAPDLDGGEWELDESEWADCEPLH